MVGTRICLIFCFRKKPAYEIWGYGEFSRVLCRLESKGPLRAPAVLELDDRADVARHLDRDALARQRAGPDRARLVQIGRASCRERASISGAAVLFKKKDKNSQRRTHH